MFRGDRKLICGYAACAGTVTNYAIMCDYYSRRDLEEVSDEVSGGVDEVSGGAEIYGGERKLEEGSYYNIFGG
jgi:hypothetical protein